MRLLVTGARPAAACLAASDSSLAVRFLVTGANAAAACFAGSDSSHAGKAGVAGAFAANRQRPIHLPRSQLI